MAVGGAFPDKTLIAELTAKMLLEVEAVQFNSEKPFIFTSGWASPVYIDCRKIISHIKARRSLITMSVALIKKEIDLKKIDFIAGGETAGIPYAAWISEKINKPMLYIRKKPKGFGFYSINASSCFDTSLCSSNARSDVPSVSWNLFKFF